MLQLKHDALGRLTRLGSGGQATVRRAPDVSLPGHKGPFVYKEYHSGIIEGRRGAVGNGLASLIRLREEANDDDRLMIDRRSTWPLAVVVNDHGATGCIMREIPPEFFRELQLLGGTRTRVAPWAWELHLQKPSDVADLGLPPLTDDRTMFLLARVLQFAATLHRLDVVVGDFSAANVLITIDEADPQGCRPMFVDIDSYRRGTNVPALPQPHTPGWETPENLHHKRRWGELAKSNADANAIARARAASRIQDKASDVYKAGLLVVRTLDGGPDAGHLRRSPAAEQRLRSLRGKRNADVVLAALSPEPRNRPTMHDVAQAFMGS